MKYKFIARQERIIDVALDMLFYNGGKKEDFRKYLEEEKIGMYNDSKFGIDPSLDSYKIGDGYVFDDIEEGELFELAFCILGVFQEAKPLEIIDAIVEKHIECLEVDIEIE